MATDPHSFSTPEDVGVTHLEWTASVDFSGMTIYATAVWHINNKRNSNTIVLDVKHLNIDEITLNAQQSATFFLGELDPLRGQALTINIFPDTTHVVIKYRTSPRAEALQWLHPSQTGTAKPFLFTQSQAILARSWVPCQDSPAIRFTYRARVSVPSELLALMSAENPQSKNETGTYSFEMKQPIPSYLLALAVGDLRFKPVSDRCGVYAEPNILERAAWEFDDLEKMVRGAELLYGNYPWERFDVLVLPPSFPFGGMENPRITFATPSILAGDRSLTSLIAHELAHSWSGNLVTNATWNDFWLNEGFTVYFEHRIMEELYGREYSEMLAVLAMEELQQTINELRADGKYHDTCLKLNLEGRSPDEGVTDIAYNKGYFFLRSLEERHGRDKFDRFVKDYFTVYAFHSINTEKFVEYIKSYYEWNFNIRLNDLENWIYKVGLPDTISKPSSHRLSKVEELLHHWLGGEKLDSSNAGTWSTQEWLYLLSKLPHHLRPEQFDSLERFGNFTASGNAEITTLWLVLCIQNEYTPSYSKIEQFLIHTGRRKFLGPIYRALMKTPDGQKRAKDIYRKARENYHFVATNTLDELLQYNS